MGRAAPTPVGAYLPTGARAPVAPETSLRAERAVGLLAAGVAGLAASGPVSDNSLLTHLATGRLQVSSGLPVTNPFLWTSSDFPVPSWWWSWLLGASEAVGGLGAVRVLTVVGAAALGWLVFGLTGNRGPAPSAATGPDLAARAGACGVALLVLVPFLNGRPHLPGFLALAILLTLWQRRLGWWWYVLLFATWVNVHGSWLYGVGVLVALWCAESLDERRLSPERARCFLAGLLGVLLGGAFYPQRFRLVTLPGEQLGDSAAREAIALFPEWRPPSAAQPWLWLFVLLCLLALYGASRPAPHGRRRWGWLLLTCAFSVLGGTALRMLPIAAITLVAPAAAGLGCLLERSRRPAATARIAAGAGAVTLFAALALALFSADLDLSRYPVDEVDWLEERGLVASSEVRLLHNDWVGNYLEFRYGADAHAWVDDRPSVETLVDYVAIRHTGDGWLDALERADPDVVLWQAGDELPEALAQDEVWNEVLTTERFRVFCHEAIAPRCR